MNSGKERDSIEVVGMGQRIVEKDESQRHEVGLAGEANNQWRERGREGCGFGVERGRGRGVRGGERGCGWVEERKRMDGWVGCGQE
jgi:hypothetical protein